MVWRRFPIRTTQGAVRENRGIFQGRTVAGSEVAVQGHEHGDFRRDGGVDHRFMQRFLDGNGTPILSIPAEGEPRFGAGKPVRIPIRGFDGEGDSFRYDTMSFRQASDEKREIDRSRRPSARSW